MKRFYNYTFISVCSFLVIMSVYSVTYINVVTERNYATNVNNEKIVSSVLLAKNTIESIKASEEVNDSQNLEIDNKEVEEVVPVATPELTPVPTPTPTPVPQVTIRYNPIDTSSYPVLSSETITMSHFGPDCPGCGSGYVASGYYVGGGRINYPDATFGNVRIVAADYKYPTGTILRLSHNGSSIIAIVLDRGGGIGDGRKYQIDLLAESEAQSSHLGVKYGVTLEVLRLGY